MLGLFVACACLYKSESGSAIIPADTFHHFLFRFPARNESRRLLLVATSSGVIPARHDSSAFIDGSSTWNRSQKSGDGSSIGGALDRAGSTSWHELAHMKSEKYSPDDGHPPAADDDDEVYPYATFSLHRSPKSSGKRLPVPSIKPPPLPSWSDLSTIQLDRHFHPQHRADSSTVSDS